MHKHPRTNSRKAIINRLFIYAVMITATLVISAICLLLILGYRFNLSSQTISQGGLLQFTSTPSSATVSIDGVPRLSTPDSINVAAGSHNLSMSLQDYRPWSKTVNVAAGEVTWVDYARFVPNNITTESIKTFDNLAQVLAAPDREQMVLLSSSNAGQLVIVDMSDSEQLEYQTVNLPNSVLSQTKQGVFSLQEWGFGSRYFLVKHSFNKQVETILVDSQQPKEAVNLSRAFGLDLAQVHFVGNSGNEFYAIANGDLRRLNLANKTISAPLAREVLGYAIYGDKYLSFVAKNDQGLQVSVVENGQVVNVRMFDSNLPVKTSLTRYFNDIYLAVSSGSEVIIYKQPLIAKSQQVVSQIKLDFPVSWLDYSSTGRFLLAGHKDRFMTYDRDTKFVHKGLIKDARAKNKKFLWIDDYHFATTGNESLRITEFDSANTQFITTMEPGFNPVLSADDKYIYSVVKQGEQYKLQASQLIID